jgi:glycerophosphoryl diester phosphodiesterase
MLTVRRPDGRVLRVGHRGAAALAPGNSIRSLASALSEHVDLVEFDVLPDGPALVLGHSPAEVLPDAPTLDDALAFLAANAPSHVGIDLDLKWHGYEGEVVGALHRHGLVERTIVCSFFPHSLRRVKELEPALLVGLSYPWDRCGLAERRALAPVVYGGIFALRRTLPLRIGRMLSRARADAAMINHLVLSRPLVERCHRLGKAVFTWTVDDPRDLERVLATGVDGVISNDPRSLRESTL